MKAGVPFWIKLVYLNGKVFNLHMQKPSTPQPAVGQQLTKFLAVF